MPFKWLKKLNTPSSGSSPSPRRRGGGRPDSDAVPENVTSPVAAHQATASGGGDGLVQQGYASSSWPDAAISDVSLTTAPIAAPATPGQSSAEKAAEDGGGGGGCTPKTASKYDNSCSSAMDDPSPRGKEGGGDGGDGGGGQREREGGREGVAAGRGQGPASSANWGPASSAAASEQDQSPVEATACGEEGASSHRRGEAGAPASSDAAPPAVIGKASAPAGGDAAPPASNGEAGAPASSDAAPPAANYEAGAPAANDAALPSANGEAGAPASSDAAPPAANGEAGAPAGSDAAPPSANGEAGAPAVTADTTTTTTANGEALALASRGAGQADSTTPNGRAADGHTGQQAKHAGTTKARAAAAARPAVVATGGATATASAAAEPSDRSAAASAVAAGGASATDAAAIASPTASMESSASSSSLLPKKAVGVLSSSMSAVGANMERLSHMTHISTDEFKAAIASWKVKTGLLAAVALLLALLLIREEQYRHALMQVVDQMADSFNALELDARLRSTYLNFMLADTPEVRPGLEAAALGLTPAYSIIIVPGFVTSGLELWQGPPCAERYFRHRIWGSMGMMTSMLRNISCWLEVMHLDPRTGGDPPSVKLRAMQGLDAIDYFMPRYVVWAGVIRALADLGYDTDDLACAPHDWRLSLEMMEARDDWFTKFKAAVEVTLRVRDRKVMVLAHSWGANVVLNFMYWVELQEPGWVERHIGVFANIGGPLLGVPKAVSALLSGEMGDTVEWGALTSFLAENLVGRRARAALFRTWGSAIQMLPQGGRAVWGNATWAPDDTPEMRAAGETYGSMMTSSRAATGAAPKSANGGNGGGALMFSPDSNAAAIQEWVLARFMGGVGSGGGAGIGVNGMDAGAAVGIGSASASSCAANASGGARGGASGGAGFDGRGDTQAAGPVRGGGGRGGGGGGTGNDSGVCESSGGSGDVEGRNVERMDMDAVLSVLMQDGGPDFAAAVRSWLLREKGSNGSGGGGSDGGGSGGGGSGSGGGSTSGIDHSTGVRGVMGDLSRGVGDPSRGVMMHDPLSTPLPNAPSLRIYCMYGVGKPADRAYHYTTQQQQQQVQQQQPHGEQHGPETRQQARQRAQGMNRGGVKSSSSSLGKDDDVDYEAHLRAATRSGRGDGQGEGEAAAGTQGWNRGGWQINTEVHESHLGLESGVWQAEGDGTVPLLSLGAMCRHPWQAGGQLNPSGIRIVTREYRHSSAQSGLLQGGPQSADHVDILGNHQLLKDVVSLAAGRHQEVTNRLVSGLDAMSSRMWAEVQRSRAAGAGGGAEARAGAVAADAAAATTA